MKSAKSFYIFIGAFALIFVLTGCWNQGGFKKVDLDLGPPPINVEDSAVDDLTPIITIGDDIAVPVYPCSIDADCYRCNNGDVYTQTCVASLNDATKGTCQGSLDLVEDCKDTCSAGQCIDDDVLTGEEFDGLIGEDFDLIDDDAGIVDNDDLLPDGTQCSTGIEKCPGYERGIGSVHLTKYPECKCSYIYVPAGCSPLEPPCPDFSSKSPYPDCACR